MSIGIWQIAVVVILVVLLFGRGKISSLMGDVAKGIKSFKKGMASDVTDDSEQKNISDDNQDSNKRVNRMPTIGWFEILILAAISIIVLGPKDFPIMLKKLVLGLEQLKDIYPIFKMKFQILISKTIK